MHMLSIITLMNRQNKKQTQIKMIYLQIQK